jgi:hypothetical protein
MKGRLFFAIIILALLISGFMPAKTGTVKVVFNNKTAERVRISLTGPATYSFKLPAGKSNQQLLPGRYRYTYTACGVQKRGSVTLNTSGDTFVIDECPRVPLTPPDTYRVVVDNKTSETVSLLVIRPERFTIVLQPGKTELDLKPGSYGYRYVACQKLHYGGFHADKDGRVVTLKGCPVSRTSIPGVVQVKIKNDTGVPILMKLVGAKTYNFTLPDGNSWIKVERGRYAYIITGCGGETIKGYKQLGPDMEWGFKCRP